MEGGRSGSLEFCASSKVQQLSIPLTALYEAFTKIFPCFFVSALIEVNSAFSFLWDLVPRRFSTGVGEKNLWTFDMRMEVLTLVEKLKNQECNLNLTSFGERLQVIFEDSIFVFVGFHGSLQCQYLSL